jgi:glycosyltransferase involved in cell wall biosynthesis
MTENHLNVCIITPPIISAGIVPLSHLVEIVSHVAKTVSVITGNVGVKFTHQENSSVFVHKILYSTGSNSLFKVLTHLHLQAKISYNILKLRSDIGVLIFFLDSQSYLLPVFFGRLLRKKVIFLLAASISDSATSRSSSIEKALVLSEQINFNLADHIIVYSPSLIEKWALNEYKEKILVAHEHFIDSNFFTITTPLPDRPLIIGYIGRLSGEKGIQNFTQALPTILSDQQDLRVFIGGDGPLRDSIIASLQEGGVAAHVNLPGWISHDDLPGYLNQLRLLVLPSYTEGLPNIMLEAMACGTPVLATPVGGIPDIIIDGKTGFIMENNSPECIAENVIRALSSPDLEQIAENGRRFVEEHFTFEETVEDWKEIFQGIE